MKEAQFCFAQHWKELQFCDVNVAPGAALNSRPLTHTHTHPSSPLPPSVFLPKPTRPLWPQGQLVWHRVPAAPPPLHLPLPHIHPVKQSFYMFSSCSFSSKTHVTSFDVFTAPQQLCEVQEEKMDFLQHWVWKTPLFSHVICQMDL